MLDPMRYLIIGKDGSVRLDRSSGGPGIAYVVGLDSPQEKLADALCKAAGLGASAVTLAAMCDELDLAEEQSTRVTQCVGIKLSLTRDDGWFAERSGRFPDLTAGAKTLGIGRTTRVEAVRDLEKKSEE